MPLFLMAPVEVLMLAVDRLMWALFPGRGRDQWFTDGCVGCVTHASVNLLDFPNLEKRTIEDLGRCAGFELTFPDRPSRIFVRFPRG